jgi:cation transport ATPase
MRRIALQCAFGGMALSVIGMALASGGLLSPVAGALSQEVMDVVAIFNALRAAIQLQELSDFAGVTGMRLLPFTLTGW